MEVSRYRQRFISLLACYVPQLCITLSVDRRLHRCGLTHIASHASSYCCWFRFYLLFLIVHPGSYFLWQQLQHRGGLTCVCVAAVSHWVAHCVNHLSFSSIRLQSHLVEVFLEPSLAVVEWWRRWSRNEVGCPEEYIIRFKSKCNEWQPTCTFNWSGIWQRMAGLHIAAWGLRRSCDLQWVSRMWFVCLQGHIVMNNSWFDIVDMCKKDIFQRKGHLVMFRSRHRRDPTWITRWRSSRNVQFAWQFPMKCWSKHWSWFVLIDQTYQPWHTRRSFPPCGPNLATSNISPNNKVNTSFNGQCSKKEPFTTSGG